MKYTTRFAAWVTPHVKEWHRRRHEDRLEGERHLGAGNYGEAEKHLTTAVTLAVRRRAAPHKRAALRLQLAEAQSPGLLKFVCLNFADEKYVLDQIIVPINSNVKTVKELAGKKVACGPGINNVTLAKIMLEHAGAVADRGGDDYVRGPPGDRGHHPAPA